MADSSNSEGKDGKHGKEDNTTEKESLKAFHRASKCDKTVIQKLRNPIIEWLFKTKVGIHKVK